MRRIGRILKVALQIYGLLYVFVFLHFPLSVMGALKELHPVAFLAPAISPAILRTYGQIAVAGDWPFTMHANELSLTELIRAEGEEQLPGNPETMGVTFNFTPDRRHGRFIYLLMVESYSSTFFGAYPALDGGGLMRIGKFFCLMTSQRNGIARAFGKSRCFVILRRPDNKWYWQALGTNQLHAVVFESENSAATPRSSP